MSLLHLIWKRMAAHSEQVNHPELHSSHKVAAPLVKQSNYN